MATSTIVSQYTMLPCLSTKEYCVTGVSNFHAQQETNPLEVCKDCRCCFFVVFLIVCKLKWSQTNLNFVTLRVCAIKLDNCLMLNRFWLYHLRIFRLFVSNKRGNLTGRRHLGLIHKPFRPSKCNVYSENYEWSYGICITKRCDINQTTFIFYMI